MRELEVEREQLGRVSEKYKVYKTTLSDDFQHIFNLQKKLQVLQQSSAENAATYQALADDHKQICFAYNQLRDNYENIAEKLSQTLKRNERLVEEKRLTDEECIRLRERAASGFEELTPRGSFSEVYKALGVEIRAKSTKAHLADLPHLIAAVRNKHTKAGEGHTKRQANA